MTWLKLQHIGDTATIFVKSAGEVVGRLGPQVRFQSDQGEDVYLPLDVATRWLTELGFAPNDGAVDYNRVCGQRLRFSRIAPATTGDRPWWRIEHVILANTTKHTSLVPVPRTVEPPVINDHLPPATGEASAPAIESKVQRRAEILAAYAWAHDAVRAIQADASRGRGAVKPTAESIEQGVTTLMLRAERANAI